MKLSLYEGWLSICLPWSGYFSGRMRDTNLIGDHMVIQRDQPVHIWGNATQTSRLPCCFRKSPTPSQMNLGGGVFTLHREGRWSLRDGNSWHEHDSHKDISWANIWVGSGQSNMGLTWTGSIMLRRTGRPNQTKSFVSCTAEIFGLSSGRCSRRFLASLYSESVKDFSAVLISLASKFRKIKRFPSD